MENPAPQRSGPPWGKIIGLGCGGCALIAIIALVGMFMVGQRAMKEITSRAPLPASQAAYAGEWQGQDGTTIAIRQDGSGDFKSGGSNVTGGTVKIDEAARTLTIGLMGIDKKWTIDQPPQDAGGTTEMKLSGMTFRRTGGFSPSGSTSTGNTPGTDDKVEGGTSAAGDTPTEEEQSRMALETLMKFNQGVQSEDFSEFYNSAADLWKRQTSPEQLKTSFQEFIDKDLDISPIQNLTPRLEQPEIDSNGVLTISGRYPTTPNNVVFKVQYIKEEGAWKSVGINVKTESPSAGDG